MCKSAAKAIRIIKRSWRIGGGPRAGGSRNVSSIRNVRVPATMSLGRRLRRVGKVDIFSCAEFFPALRQTQQFPRGHLDKRDHLAAFGSQQIIFVTANAERAPESRTVQLIDRTFNVESSAKRCRESI